MKKFGLFLCLVTMLGILDAAAQSAARIEIWGSVTQSARCKKDKKNSFGLYKIVVKDGEPSFTPLATGNKHYAANGGGIISDGRCDFVNVSGSRAELRSFNTLNWKSNADSGEDVSENDIITSAAAYDPSTEKVYACLTDNKGREHSYGYVDYDNYRRTKIGYNENHYVAMAVDGQGTLYGITVLGILHKIDKRSGKSTPVGTTGVTPAGNVQSMAYNPNDGKMYWAASPQKGTTFLCTVNLSDASINKVCTFPDNDNISSMYIPLQPEAKAPARLCDMEVTFEGALNKGTITFTTPTEHYDGTPIAGDIEYEVMVDENMAGPFTVSPGEKISTEVFVDEAGMHNFKVVLRTEGKTNPYNSISKWIGYDEPSPIRNLKYYTTVDKLVYLSWKAPRGGRHGGYVDMKNLVYKIVRNPGGLVVSEACEDTTFQDDVSSGGSNGFYYEVTPYIKK